MRYIKRNVTKDWLLKNDFRYNRYFSSKDDSVYTQRFTVLTTNEKDKKKPSLECELLLYYPEGIICVNVYQAGTRDKFAPFYNSTYGDWDKILSVIHDKIESKIKRLGAELIE